MARFGAIKPAIVTQLQTLVPATLALVKGVPGNSIFETPESYPAAYVSLDTPKQLEKAPIALHTTLRYQVPFYVVVYASSDGTAIGDAEATAWTLVDAVSDCLTNFTITTGLTAGVTVWPVILGDPAPVSVEVGKYGIAIPCSVDIQWIT